MAQGERSSGRVSRAALGVLVTLLAVVTVAGFLCLFIGIAILRVHREQTAASPPTGAPTGPASSRADEPADDWRDPAHAAPATRATEPAADRPAPAQADARAAELPHRAAPAAMAPLSAAAPLAAAAPPAEVARPAIEPPPAPAAPAARAVRAAPHATASLLRVDDASRGGWVGRYGKKGYFVAMAGEAPHLPPGVRMEMDRSHLYPWSPVTTDPRALSIPETPSRLSAGQWFSWDHFSTDLDLRCAGEDGYQVALYLLDWDTDGRAQRLEVTDADTGAVLLSRADEHFRNGRYLILRLSGHVTLRFTKTAGANCTLSGVFFDDPPPATP